MTAFVAGQRVVLNWEYETAGATIGTVESVDQSAKPHVFGVRWDDGKFETLYGDELAPGE